MVFKKHPMALEDSDCVISCYHRTHLRTAGEHLMRLMITMHDTTIASSECMGRCFMSATVMTSCEVRGRILLCDYLGVGVSVAVEQVVKSADDCEMKSCNGCSEMQLKFNNVCISLCSEVMNIKLCCACFVKGVIWLQKNKVETGTDK